jgi:type IV pilus assembly protein PilA
VKTQSFAAWVALNLLFACAGAPPPSPIATIDSATPAPSAPVAVATATQTPSARIAPSQALRKAWPFADGARFVLYANIGGFVGTDLGKTLMPFALHVVVGEPTDDKTRCLAHAVAAARELLVGVDDDGVFVLETFDEGAVDASACLRSEGGQPVAIDGAKEAFSVGERVVVHEPGLLLAGRSAIVKRALAQRSSPPSLPGSIALAADEYAVWTARPEAGVHASGTLVASSARFRLGVQADIPETQAADLEQGFRAVQLAGKVPGLDGAAADLVAKFLPFAELRRDGGHVDGALDLREAPADQARDLGMAVTVAISGLRSYIAQAKVAEARNCIGQIGRDYVAWWERDDPGQPPRAKRKLRSFPPVPATVPRGTKYQSTAADWKAWAPLRFTMDVPQNYQYEVRAAKGGETAEIIARGDLDGDGKIATFTLDVQLDRKHGNEMMMSPTLRETDADE